MKKFLITTLLLTIALAGCQHQGAPTKTETEVKTPETTETESIDNPTVDDDNSYTITMEKVPGTTRLKPAPGQIFHTTLDRRCILIRSTGPDRPTKEETVEEFLKILKTEDAYHCPQWLTSWDKESELPDSILDHWEQSYDSWEMILIRR